MKDLLCIVFGNAATAAGAAFFVVPNGLVVGGTTGIGVFVRHFFPDVSISMIVLILNIVLFTLGFLFLGKNFALKTLLGTLLYPGFMFVFERIIGEGKVVEDPMLATLCGGVLVGVGIGSVFRVGSSTGGMDIPPLILQKFFHLPASIGVWIFDFIVILMQCFVCKFEMVLYGVIMAAVYSIIIEKVSLIGQKKMQVKIVSEKYREIHALLIGKLDHGVTLLHGKTGWLCIESDVILSVVPARDVNHLTEEVQKIDPNAFITISTVSEVKGRGFTSERVHLPKKESSDETISSNTKSEQ